MMEECTHITVERFVVGKIDDVCGLARVPVTADELLQQDGVTHFNIDVPSLQPLGAVGGAGYRSTDLTSEVSPLVDGDCVARLSQSSRSRETTDTATDDSNVEPPESVRRRHVCGCVWLLVLLILFVCEASLLRILIIEGFDQELMSRQPGEVIMSGL